jgi:hypothetical protein
LRISFTVHAWSKAANTLPAAVLGSDPREVGGQRVIFLSGDDVAAKAQVRSLFEDAGYFPIDLGESEHGRRDAAARRAPRRVESDPTRSVRLAVDQLGHERPRPGELHGAEPDAVDGVRSEARGAGRHKRLMIRNP